MPSETLTEVPTDTPTPEPNAAETSVPAATDTATTEPTPTEAPTEEPTPTATAAEMAYLGNGHVLAAPLMALPVPAPLGAPPHRLISYTHATQTAYRG